MITLKKKRIFALSLLLITIISFIVSALPCKNIVNAQTTAYSDVLDDLREDASFNISDFPEQLNNCSLSVITIAESENKELFVYVYQPSGPTRNYMASYINISTDERVQVDEDGNLKFYVYSLSFCNSFNTLYKYKVDDFAVSEDDTRFYQITSIFRPFDETMDKQADFDNKVTGVNFDVCKQYTFTTVNGKVSTYCSDIEYIRITDKFVGFVRYKDGIIPSFGAFYDTAFDSHFVAFNTDRDIDKLLEADLWYTCQSYEKILYANPGYSYTTETFGQVLKQNAYLTYEDDMVVYKGVGLFAGTYKYDTIQTIDEFINSVNVTQCVYSGCFFDVSTQSKITEDGLKALKGKKWVLRFADSLYGTTIHYTDALYHYSEHTTRYTIVGDVTIFRLKFETDGVIYNLGVLDNMQTGSLKPINETFLVVRLKSKWKWILIIIVIIILFIFFWPVLPYILNFVVWVISLPFKFIASVVKLFKKNKDKKE